MRDGEAGWPHKAGESGRPLQSNQSNVKLGDLVNKYLECCVVAGVRYDDVCLPERGDEGQYEYNDCYTSSLGYRPSQLHTTCTF